MITRPSDCKITEKRVQCSAKECAFLRSLASGSRFSEARQITKRILFSLLFFVLPSLNRNFSEVTNARQITKRRLFGLLFLFRPRLIATLTVLPSCLHSAMRTKKKAVFAPHCSHFCNFVGYFHKLKTWNI